MKALLFTIYILCTTVITIKGAAVKAPLDIISLDDLTKEDRATLEYLNSQRPKRSEDLLTTLKHSIGQGIKKKIGQIAKSSAGASAHFSAGSSGHEHDHDYHHHYHHHYEHPPPIHDHDHKSFDFWSLKKSILNTLLQAVKAIKGGVIAVKGQLIKGGGHLISAKGKLISSKGEAITSLGKHIAASALLSPAHAHTAPAVHVHDYAHQHHYGPPPPPDIYGAPSSHGEDIGHTHLEGQYLPQKQQTQAVEDQFAHGAQAGILILKKIPKGRELNPVGQESKVTPIKSIKPDIKENDIGFKEIIGKFFSASTSLNPEQPELIDAQYEPSAPAAQYQESEHYEDSHTQEANNAVKPPSTNYGVPFEEPPSGYLDFYKETESKNVPKTTHNSKPPQEESKEPPQSYKEGLQNYKTDGLEVFSTSNPSVPELPMPEFKNIPPPDFKQQHLLNGVRLSASPENLPNIESFPPFPGPLPTEFLAKYQPYDHPKFHFAEPPPSGPGPFTSIGASPSSNIHSSLKPYPSEMFLKRPSRGQRTHTRTTSRHKQPQQPPYDLVRSVAYKLGPHGPIKL